MPIKLNSAGGGSVTINAASTASATVLTVPATNANLVTTGDSGSITGSMIASNTITGSLIAGLPAGSIVQAVSGTSTTEGSTNSTSFLATGVSASITPKSATNKILAIFSIQCLAFTSGSYAIATLYRGAVNLGNANYGFGYVNQSAGAVAGVISSNYLDSPATTSSVTYQIYFKMIGGTGYYVTNGALSGVTLLEIVA